MGSKSPSINHIRRLVGNKSDLKVVCVISERISYLQRIYSEVFDDCL